MKHIALMMMMCAGSLAACATSKTRPPEVNTAAIGKNLERIGASVEDLDALADDMEARGQ